MRDLTFTAEAQRSLFFGVTTEAQRTQSLYLFYPIPPRRDDWIKETVPSGVTTTTSYAAG